MALQKKRQRRASDRWVYAYELDPPLAVDAGIGSDWLSAK